MDLEYDHKFEEMKKYIPFLENMITRLESTNTTSSNPRQAQLDKIRSLRDLLSNKKKRMKMENLLKCEQVLVNLYAKVEQRDTLSSSKKEKDSCFSIDAPTPKEKSDLEAVRNKLKTVVKRQVNVQDTLPEILPRSEINDVQTSGTKEPALFQRRPNHTNKDTEEIKATPPVSTSKRLYTRVLVSPETSSRRWSSSETPSEKPLFSRRSPRKSPRRDSPSYYKKERKKSRERQSRKQKDLNITLNVPEESLNSLNTKDILSRIINCSDGDVDIDTLRELRKQILGELQKTGARDDISDLILKSYNKNNHTRKKPTKKEEIEEGELSDSESEAIESIYGSLVIKEPGLTKNSTENDTQPRKIQICLVINSDTKSEAKTNELLAQDSTKFVELEMYEDKEDNKFKVGDEAEENVDYKRSSKITMSDEKTTSSISEDKSDGKNSQKITKDSVTSIPGKEATANSIGIVSTEEEQAIISSSEGDKTIVQEAIPFRANFYQPLNEPGNSAITDSKNKDSVPAQEESGNDTKTSTSFNICQIESTLENMEKSTEIPLLHERTIEKQPPDSTLSEIDILQALKKEILSEITVPGTESTTPLLHQPKVIKVANVQANQTLPKKRISIEKYKEKSVTCSQSNLNKISPKDEQLKKTSLKLTDKECERFFNVPKISFDDEDESLDEYGAGDIEASDVYGDLAPKSPDFEDSSYIEPTPPVIIPVNPVKSVPIDYKADVDMRALPLLSPNHNKTQTMYNNIITNTHNDLDKTNTEIKTDHNQSQNRPMLIDPRVRRDLNPTISTQSPNPHSGNPDRTSRQIYPGVPSSSTPNTIMTPNARTYEMTPTHQSFEIDQSNRKHVYVSMSWETDSIGDRRSRIDEVREPCWKSQTDDIAQNKRFSDSFNNDKYGNGPPNNRYLDQTAFLRSDVMRKEGSMTPLPSFGRSDCPATPSHPFGRLECPPTPTHAFGRLECPPTPSHPFGRLDCPLTPSLSFGRLECPPTPSHSFGRIDCPTTPSHPFGRSECPPTPSHSFGRIDCPTTPSHPFGRSDCPPTPNNPFGRSDAPPPHMLSMSDCPNTPTNSFVGADGPSTPTPILVRNEVTTIAGHTYAKSLSQTNLPYGRTDSLTNQFGRSDYNTSSYIKDPRLNRKSDSELKSQYDERDQTYYKGKDRFRNSSYSSQKSYSGSGSYRQCDRALSANRNSKYKYFAPDQRGRHLNKDQDRRDRSLSKDQESSGAYGRERWYKSDNRPREEVGLRREYVREKSIGRSSGQGGTRSSLRAHSVSKGNTKDSNTLSVKSNTGRAFTIDTSINATFQRIIDSANEIQGFVNSFDIRRQRAGSVGRSLTREPSVALVPLQALKVNNSDNGNNRQTFQRASSVGREVFDPKKDKRSFQEIKADFRSCSFSGNKFIDDKNTEHSSHSKKETYDQKKNEQREPERNEAKSSYSPRRNYRDPRMRKLSTNKTERHSLETYGHKSGIVYSNDNIVAGSILASGYGVKNYKIPKIKRTAEEKEETLAKPDSIIINDYKEKNDPKVKDGNKEKELSKEKLHSKEQRGKGKTDGQKEVTKKQFEKSMVSDSTEKRLTRSSKKSMEEADTDIVGKPRKFKKLIYNSDSDDDIVIKSKDFNIKEKTIVERDIETKNADLNKQQADVSRHHTKDTLSECEEFHTDSKSDIETADVTIKEKMNPKTKMISHISPVKAKKTKNVDCIEHDSSFGLDELEMFSDNVVSDPVIENITALIADLDNDLNTSKSDTGHQFTKEITLENMMENISSPAKDRSMGVEEEDSAKDRNKDSNIRDEEFLNHQPKINAAVDNSLPSAHLENDCLYKELISQNAKDKDKSGLKYPAGDTPTQSDAENNDDKNDVDSTTETKKTLKPNEERAKSDENAHGCSTPDSTINTEDTELKSINEESLPGSTNEVTSTESIELKPSCAKEVTPGLNSIGSLLSILQDKSKIKELLSMLGDQSSENEKIKKKLEKLSEIVSDDEESCDVPTTNIDQEVGKVIPSEITDTNIDRIEKTDVKKMEVIDDEQLSRDSNITNDSSIANSFKTEDDNSKTSDIEVEVIRNNIDIPNVETIKKKKTKNMKKVNRKAKKGAVIAAKRITRAAAAESKPKVKKIPRELMQLQEDIKEMFIRDEVLSATGIRMCRLAKLVDEKITPSKDEQTATEVEPVVVLEKFKDAPEKYASDANKIKKKKIVTKAKFKTFNDSVPELITEDKEPISLKHKPGPKSKTKNKKDSDIYAFESDLVCNTVTEKAGEDGFSSNSDSESDSIASSKSFSSTELLSDLKKKTKRKRRGWQAGVIKTKTKKKKEPLKKPDPKLIDEDILPEVSVPDLNCFTDQNYCFRKNLFSYSCRLCPFTGTDIVLHYRNQHPHIEIPLSRMTPEVAKAAIEQCVDINFKAISKITSEKYVCTFCFKEFTYSKSVLETFFWHIVSMHTGEYKQNCSECVNVNECPFNLDIPPPPKDTKGQLIGFICKKCNFTQISLENLKTHVIVRHNDEQTAVYTINLSAMTQKALSALIRRSKPDEIALQASSSTDQVFTDIHEKCKDSTEGNDSDGVKTRTSAIKSNVSVTPPIQSKITFEGDDNISEATDSISEEASIKIENADVISNNVDNLATDIREIDRSPNLEDQLVNQPLEGPEPRPSSDITNCPHFKINLTESGAKEYLCCINDNYHFKTTLLISMKKHVQSKHSENWDGYCYVCKVIVTPQGAHSFNDCLQHYLDKHLDNFPILEKEITKPVPAPRSAESPAENPLVTKSYINVRPLSELITRAEDITTIQGDASLPIIQSVRSLGSSVEDTQLKPTFPSDLREKQTEKETFRYEEHQAEVVAKKYYLVVEAMMTTDSLVKVFKCSGRYCLYATDSTEEALAHATTHQRVGGIDALNCCYCDFDSAGNAVDLVMHIFKQHGNCHYCCPQCFYRAASSQAVRSHISRVHGVTPVPGSVMRTTMVSTIPTLQFKMLTREEAVSYYICGHRDIGDSCKFRAYTPDKFCEHLLQRHSAASAHPCHLCALDVVTPADLVQHMKIHGIKLYQCTWCVHGADNESEMLAHVSIRHPNKQPQAYIRIITKKDSSNGLRVLPLAVLTKHKIEAKDVTPSVTKEHPVREAERSIEMEALIGPFITEPLQNPVYQTNEPPIENTDTIQTSEIPEELINTSEDTKPAVNVNIRMQTAQVPQVIQPQAPTPTDGVSSKPTATVTPSPSLTSSPKLPVADTPLNVSPVTNPPVTSSLVKAPETINSIAASRVMPSYTQMPVLKTELIDTEKVISTGIVVLDSDEEDTSNDIHTAVIDLSNDEASTSSKQETSKIIPIANLYTCPQCKQICKNMGGFKKHIYSCVTDLSRSFQCPHCTYHAENLDKITLHYVADHTQKSTFGCGLCGALLVSENFARKHMRSVHKEGNIVFTRGNKARVIVTVKEQQKEKVLPKRKLSGPKTDPIPVKRRFGPQEIDQLPINPILDQLVYCSRCEFSTKVRLNMVRHLQLHADQQPVPQTAPVNPVPHLESNEKHFDKMLNLASSSIINRTLDKSRVEHTPSVTMLIPPEAASRYPKYVPERQRHTCGAKGCSYISVDEAMLRRHWDALHSGTSDFHCVHCPPHQHLDTSKPLTATRIVSHLKMHDSTLYACSSCSYYHFKREAIEKHLSEIHKTGRLMVVREEQSAPVSPAPVQSNAAPTMDLKPWQCGLCKFKSMLRPEVVEHCSKFHQSKMQFKCAYCPFRTSAIENVTKHQTNSHAGKPEEVFYYYYREGSIPDESDGTQRWVKQRQKAGPSEPEVKVETSVSPKTVTSVVTTPLTIDLNLVKKEVNDAADAGPPNMEELCKQFGQFCEPNGIKYKCPLCSVVMEDTRELIQSHLYEELNYRKWSCGLCSYKAFHKAGLTDHMSSEHRRQYDHIELPTNINIETWVTGVLDHQAAIINKHKENLAKQKIVVETNKPSPSTEIVIPKENVGKYTDRDLETAFGSFGLPNCIMYCCPKCGFLSKDEILIRDHLEMELNKIRWCCTNCPENFQTYHEAQFHCKGHDGPSRPIEALRDPAMRAVWVSTAIQKQKQVIQDMPTTSTLEPPTPENIQDNDNSLLVVRYEEKVPTPDQVHLRRKRTALESDDEKLVIDEPPAKKKVEKHCPHCDYKSVYYNNFRVHMLSHYGLKPYSCGYCPYNNSTKRYVTKHVEQMHPDKPMKVKTTDLPLESKKTINLGNTTVICLVCEKPIPESDTHTHLHNNVKPEFSSSSIAHKCCICSNLYRDLPALMEHHNTAHHEKSVNYVLYRLGGDTTQLYKCVYCDSKYKYIKDCRAHHVAAHPNLQFKINAWLPNDIPKSKGSDVIPPVQKRCARKSTTKLPNFVAKKSTTKLPNNLPSFKDEYSYYGTKPPPLQQYANVTTMMSFCNMMMPFSLKQLSEHLNIEPQVKVTDLKDSTVYKS